MTQDAWPHPFYERARGLGRPLVFGHRGAKARFTENTLESFQLARDAGADGIELDVRQCQSGEVVVFHDLTLSRMAGRGERIAAMPWSDLASVIIGRDSRIPTLPQVLDVFDDPDLLINIEVKSTQLGRAGGLVDQVLECVSQARGEAVESILISSFDPFVIGRVRQRAPHLATGYLFHDDEPRVLRRAWRAPPLRPHALHPDFRLVENTDVHDWHASGLSVAVWTVDQENEIRRMAGLGVDAIISDDPAHTLAVLRHP